MICGVVKLFLSTGRARCACVLTNLASLLTASAFGNHVTWPPPDLAGLSKSLGLGLNLVFR
jgi:hypothetical protein